MLNYPRRGQEAGEHSGGIAIGEADINIFTKPIMKAPLL